MAKVETRRSSPLITARPEEVELGTVRPAVDSAFKDRGLSHINIREIIVAENVVLEALRSELSETANPYALYMLRGQITSIIINAIADFRKYQPDK